MLSCNFVIESIKCAQKGVKVFLHQLGFRSNLQFQICKDQGLWQIQPEYRFSSASLSKLN